MPTISDNEAKALGHLVQTSLDKTGTVHLEKITYKDSVPEYRARLYQDGGSRASHYSAYAALTSAARMEP